MPSDVSFIIKRTRCFSRISNMSSFRFFLKASSTMFFFYAILSFRWEQTIILKYLMPRHAIKNVSMSVCSGWFMKSVSCPHSTELLFFVCLCLCVRRNGILILRNINEKGESCFGFANLEKIVNFSLPNLLLLRPSSCRLSFFYWFSSFYENGDLFALCYK